MREIGLGQIKMSATDADGAYATVELDGETVGVSLPGEDDAVRDLDELELGQLVEAGTEQVRIRTRKQALVAWIDAALDPMTRRALTPREVAEADQEMVGACGSGAAHLLVDAGGEDVVSAYTQEHWGEAARGEA